MGDRKAELFNEVSQLITQYRQEVPGHRRAWPESVKDRVLELERLGLKKKDIAERTGISYYTIFGWGEARKAPRFEPVAIVPSRRALPKVAAVTVAASMTKEAGREVTPLEAYQRYPFDVNREFSAGAQGGRQYEQGAPSAVPPRPQDIPVTVADAKHLQLTPAEAKKQSPRGTFRNAHLNWDIGVASKGLQRTERISKSPEAVAALMNVGKLLESAVYDRSEAPLKNDTNIKAYHIFYAPLQAGNDVHAIRLKVRETNEGEKFYHALTSEEARPAGSLVGAPGAPGKLHPVGGARTMKLADFESLVNAERKRFPLFQQGGEGPRGRIRFLDEAEGKFRSVITLFKTADKSTFLHELGHHFLNVLESRAQEEGAPEDVKKDYQTVRDWVGAKDGEGLTSEQHEKWARGFERYLMEGEAPSVGLRAAFSRFKDWLVSIYKDVRNLKVELSPEVRDVMDRMLASKDEIARAKREVGMEDLPLDKLPDDVKARPVFGVALAKAQNQLLATSCYAHYDDDMPMAKLDAVDHQR